MYYTILYYILYSTQKRLLKTLKPCILLMPEVSAAYIVSAATWTSMARRFGSRAAHLLRPAYGPGVALAGLNNASPERPERPERPESCCKCYNSCYNR